MVASDFDHPQKLFINKDNTFFNRLLSKEASNGNTSFRVYYGVAPGEVPFQWETRPGTPKWPAFKDELPPLTPPPSFLFSSRPSSKRPKSSLMSKLSFLKFNTWKLKPAPSKKPLAIGHIRSRNSSSTSSSSSMGGCDEELEFSGGSPVSTFRASQLQKSSSNVCLPMMAVKDVIWPRRHGRSASCPTHLSHSYPY